MASSSNLSSSVAALLQSSKSLPSCSIVTSPSNGVEAGIHGIGIDEDLTGASSKSIPVNRYISLRGKDVSQVTIHSLPTSPSKGCLPSRSIESLREEIRKLKESGVHGTSGLKVKDQLQHGKEVEHSRPMDNGGSKLLLDGGQCVEGKSSIPTNASKPSDHPEPSSASRSMPLLMDHDKTPRSSMYHSKPLCPVLAITPCNTQNPLDIPNPLQKSTSAIPLQTVQKQLPSGKAPLFPPTKIEFNSNLAPKHVTELEANFPPLTGTKNSTIPPPSNQTHDDLSPTHTKTSWSQLFNANRVKVNGTALEYISSNTGKANSVSITKDEVAEELERWNNALVGFVLDAKPPYKLMKQFVDRRWKAFGSIELFILKPGIYVFNFQDEETKQKVLEMGPWSYFDKPLLLKPWSPSQNYDRTCPDKLPVWVRLPYLKLHPWSSKSLSKITSQIGQPLFTDRMTALRQRLAYARICIEVDIHSNLPHRDLIKRSTIDRTINSVGNFDLGHLRNPSRRMNGKPSMITST